MKWSPPEISDYIDISSVVNENKETDSEHDDITTKTYCRGLTLAQIGIPRLPHGIRSKDVSSNKIHMQAAFNALPKSRGRGRAKMLEEREDHFMRIRKEYNDVLNSLENMDTSSTIDSTSITGGSETSSLFGDCELSDSDDVTDQPILLPSQRNIKLPERPFVKPNQYNFNSIDDFPLLGSQDSDASSNFKEVTHKKKPGRRKPKEDKFSSKPLTKSDTKKVKSVNSCEISNHTNHDKVPAYSVRKGFPIPVKTAMTNSVNSNTGNSRRNKNLNPYTSMGNVDLKPETLDSYSKLDSQLHLNSQYVGSTCQEQTIGSSFDDFAANLDIASNTFGSFTRSESSNKSGNVSQARPRFPNMPKSLSDNSKYSKSSMVAAVKPTVNGIVKPTKTEARVIEHRPENTCHNTMLDWKITGPRVVQLEGIPIACDIDILDDTLCNFGQIEDSQVQVIDGKYAIRYRFNTEDACEWIVSSLHDTDMLYPDSQSVLVCFKVQ